MPIRGALEKLISSVSTAYRVLAWFAWEVGPTVISEQSQKTPMDHKEDDIANAATQEPLEQSSVALCFFQKRAATCF